MISLKQFALFSKKVTESASASLLFETTYFVRSLGHTYLELSGVKVWRAGHEHLT